MDIQKSTRHSKITGDFAETTVLYWLSKYGFECAQVDHTGIDLIARNPKTDELMGISVKARSRSAGTERSYLGIPNDQFEKVDAACKAFLCNPYFAILVDAGDLITFYIISKEHLLGMHPMGNRVCSWKMTEVWQQKYLDDPEIKTVSFRYSTDTWW